MRKTRVTFIWGSGGVGKSHIAIREAFHSPQCLLMTLDPSYRLYDLLDQPDHKSKKSIQIADSHFDLVGPQVDKLFDQLHQASPASDQIRSYYFRLVNGLHRFREYLALLQLADYVQSEDYEEVIVDTPPFQEAVGLHQSLNTLQTFFGTALVQFALKSSVLYKSFKRIVDLGRYFVGRRGIEEAFAFIEWLSQNLERFQKSSQVMGELLRSPQTQHRYIVTPETQLHQFALTEDFFRDRPNLQFYINRSVHHEAIPSEDDQFCGEILNLQEREREVRRYLEKEFPGKPIEGIPLQLMGSDSQEELLRFIRSPSV